MKDYRAAAEAKRAAGKPLDENEKLCLGILEPDSQKNTKLVMINGRRVADDPPDEAPWGHDCDDPLAPAGVTFSRGDHVELGERLVVELNTNAEDVLFDDGRLYRCGKERHVFETVERDAASRIVQGFAGGVVVGKKPRLLKIQRTDVAGAFALACDRVSRPGFFAGAHPGVAFQDRFVETDGARDLPLSVDHRARFAYPFHFIPQANPEGFVRFLGEVFRDDADAEQKIALIREYVGACIAGFGTRYQVAVITLGEGDNGKSVLNKIIGESMPPGTVSAIPPQEWGNEYKAALLSGKLLNVVSELPEADILDGEKFKGIVAGDPTTARHIREAPFMLRPLAGHIFAANRLPGATDMTHGFWRRFVVVSFNRRFAEHEKDRELADKIISTELPTIVSWFVEGARAVSARGRLVLPESHSEIHAEWQRNADPIARFLAECTEPDAEFGERSAQLYRRFRSWAAENGHRLMASNKFGAGLQRLLGKPVHRALGNVYPVRLRAAEGL